MTDLYDLSAWTQPDSEHLTSRDGLWSLTHRVDDGRPGWYLAGPDCPAGEWLEEWPLCARLKADEHIAAYRAATDTTGGTR
ncbi:hypothetical protein [Embleya sp. NPDC020630]|uniref:hypothetical protein n=1 Tax=Embleya sp. NPDC020630 TaxID=3363979 RepID=UPI0037B608C9